MESLLWVGIVQSGFVATFLMLKNNKNLDDKVLAAWMLTFVLPVLSGMTDRLFPDVYVPILSSDFIYPLLHGPLMLLYVKALAGDIDRLDPGNLLHFLPFGAVCVVQLLTGWAPRPPSPNATEFGMTIRVLGGVNLAILLAYNVAIFNRLFRHDQKIANHFSELSNRVTLAWLRWIAVGLSVTFLLLALASILSIPSLVRVHIFAQTAFIFALSFFGLRQPRVFVLTRGAGGQDDVAVDDQKAQYGRSGLTGDRRDMILRKLLNFMQKEQPYLDPEFTIEKMAKRMSIQRHHLTEVINGRLEKNFFNFVNEYRVNAVKQVMASPDGQKRTLLDIAQDCGFNSKSSFNLAFKRITGVTPSQYRKHPK